MKTCFKCGAEKPLTDFYKHSGMKDGRLNKCKECNKKDVRENRADKVEYYREYDRKRYEEDPLVRSRIRNVAERWRVKHPDRKRAHDAVSKAVRSGKLVRGTCEVCGRSDVHGHHEDYSKPIDVMWLCPVHHKALHDTKEPTK